MKTQFIQIDDISEIDTSKATVYDLNKRYIDRAGNMYSLRFNHTTKKVEIIKVMRTTARNQTYYTQRMMQNRRTSKSQDVIEVAEESDNPPPEEGYFTPKHYDENIPYFDPDRFRSDMFAALITHKERIAGITKNLSNARLVMREQREQSIRFDDHLRNLDIDGVQRIDKIINSYREMTDYPRSINYYIGHLDSRARTMVGEIAMEEKKLKFVMLHEMYQMLKDLFFILSRHFVSLKDFVSEIREKRYAKLTNSEKQSLSDATVSIDNTIIEIRDFSEKLKRLEEYIFNPVSFS
jgi:hypothetical protein